MLKRAFLLVVSFVGACASSFSVANAPAGPPVREFVLANSTLDPNLDPLHTYTTFESQFYTAFYEGLVVSNPNTLAPEPGMAASWDTADKGKTWVFRIRPDAKYSNGDKVRAQDFVASWLRMLDPANNAENSYLFDVIKGARAFRTGALKDASKVGIKAVSESTLQVELENPAAHFLKLLTHFAFVPLHPSLISSTGWNKAQSVIGNGPFVITSRTDTDIILEKNPYYWDLARLGVDRLRIHFMDDANDATDGYITGKYNWVTESLVSFGKLEANDRVEVKAQFATTYLYFVCAEPPWNDSRVRRALALLVPWDKIRTKDTFTFPSELLVPSIPNYPAVKGIASQQVDEGMKLLADAGFPNGKGLPPLVIKISAGSTGLKKLLQQMADAWQSFASLSVVWKEVNADSYFTEIHKSDYTLAESSWIGDYADPLTFLQMWTTGSNLNDARYSDAGYDAAVNEAISMTDNRARYQKLADAEQMLLSKAAILPLDHQPSINLINTDAIGGWFSNPLDIHPFKFLSFKVRATPPGIAMAVTTP
jgi:peptide/nickel transport system substrate-binding protein/oligopeptide transport system substrate-binding protein